MVSDNHGIEAHRIHDLYRRFACKKVRPGVSLDHIAGRQKKGGFFFPQFGCAKGQMGDPALQFIGPYPLVAFGESMEIVDIEDP